MERASFFRHIAPLLPPGSSHPPRERKRPIRRLASGTANSRSNTVAARFDKADNRQNARETGECRMTVIVALKKPEYQGRALSRAWDRETQMTASVRDD